MKFKVILTPDPEDGGFVAECPSIPGCISEGATVAEALRNIREAVEGCLESLAARQEALPEETQQEIRYGLYVLAKIEAGERAIEEGEVVSQEKAERRIEELLRSLDENDPGT